MQLINSKELIVLAYHTINDKCNFEKQIRYLLANYEIVKEMSGNSDQRQVIITADDGDVSFYHHAFPVLKKYKIPAILFIITDLIDSDKPFWWTEIPYYLGEEEGNRKVWEVKTWPNREREKYLQILRKNSAKPELKYKQLSTNQLQEMKEAGIVIANHSHTHPMFNKCTTGELDRELEKSTEKLRQLDFNPHIFAYPNGNFSETSEKKLMKYGIKKAPFSNPTFGKGGYRRNVLSFYSFKVSPSRKLVVACG